MMMKLYQSGLQKKVKILSLTLLTASTLFLGVAEVVNKIELILSKPIGYSDFVSLDKEGKTISCDNMSLMLSDINIAVQEKNQANHINQCEIQIKENVHKHCQMYVANIQDFLLGKTQTINYLNGSKEICSKELSDSFASYNDDYKIIEKNNSLFIDSQKYHRKYPLPLLFVKKQSVAITPTAFNDNLWQVSFDYAPSYNSVTQILVFSDKEKAMNLFTILTNPK